MSRYTTEYGEPISVATYVCSEDYDFSLLCNRSALWISADEDLPTLERFYTMFTGAHVGPVPRSSLSLSPRLPRFITLNKRFDTDPESFVADLDRFKAAIPNIGCICLVFRASGQRTGDYIGLVSNLINSFQRPVFLAIEKDPFLPSAATWNVGLIENARQQHLTTASVVFYTRLIQNAFFVDCDLTSEEQAAGTQMLGTTARQTYPAWVVNETAEMMKAVASACSQPELPAVMPMIYSPRSLRAKYDVLIQMAAMTLNKLSTGTDFASVTYFRNLISEINRVKAQVQATPILTTPLADQPPCPELIAVKAALDRKEYKLAITLGRALTTAEVRIALQAHQLVAYALEKVFRNHEAASEHSAYRAALLLHISSGPKSAGFINRHVAALDAQVAAAQYILDKVTKRIAAIARWSSYLRQQTPVLPLDVLSDIAEFLWYTEQLTARQKVAAASF